MAGMIVPVATVLPHSVAVGQRVRRNEEHWRTGKNAWRDDKRGTGTVIGHTDEGGVLVGSNSGAKYDTDRITHASGPGWAVVRWDAAGKCSVYPVGSSGPFGSWRKVEGPCFSLLLAE